MTGPRNPIPLPEKPVVGTTELGGPGVLGKSVAGVGVQGQSLNAPPPSEGQAGDGVLGDGTTGVHGRSGVSLGSGVWGEHSTGGPGVLGSSVNGAGVSASSQHGIGLSASGAPAGFFQGDVQVTGSIKGPTVDGLKQQLTALQQQLTNEVALFETRVKTLEDDMQLVLDAIYAQTPPIVPPPLAPGLNQATVDFGGEIKV